jgi:hypothetical protein
MVSCACGICGRKVAYFGNYRQDLPAGFKNVNPGNIRELEDRWEVKRLTAAATAAEEIPALTETQIYNATKKAIDLFDKNYLLFRKQNKKKGIIVPSIAVSAEGLHPSTGKNRKIDRERNGTCFFVVK